MTTPEQNTGSTGGLGLDRRTFNRLYMNYRFGVVRNIHSLEQFAQRGRQAVESAVTDAVIPPRVVGRFLVGDALLRQAVASENIAPFIEAVVPTGITTVNGSGREPVWMLMGAINHPNRRSVHSTEAIIRDVDESVRQRENNPPPTPLVRIQNLRRRGYSFIRDIPAGRENELLELWEKVFDWTREGIADLQGRLRQERDVAPVKRGVWFSGLIDPRNNRLVAAATAERLNIPVGDGRMVPLVESTEWIRSDAARGGAGLMAGTVAHLHGQVIQDLETIRPLPIGEVNYSSGAHNVGLAVGMRVPSRDVYGGSVPQVLTQNVRVGDGKSPEGLRDFTMMYLPEAARRSLYDPASRAAMLREGGV